MLLDTRGQGGGEAGRRWVGSRTRPALHGRPRRATRLRSFHPLSASRRKTCRPSDSMKSGTKPGHKGGRLAVALVLSSATVCSEDRLGEAGRRSPCKKSHLPGSPPRAGTGVAVLRTRAGAADTREDIAHLGPGGGGVRPCRALCEKRPRPQAGSHCPQLIHLLLLLKQSRMGGRGGLVPSRAAAWVPAPPGGRGWRPARASSVQPPRCTERSPPQGRPLSARSWVKKPHYNGPLLPTHADAPPPLCGVSSRAGPRPTTGTAGARGHVTEMTARPGLGTERRGAGHPRGKLLTENSATGARAKPARPRLFRRPATFGSSRGVKMSKN